MSKLKTYKVAVEYFGYDYIKVEAKSVKEAREIVTDELYALNGDVGEVINIEEVI